MQTIALKTPNGSKPVEATAETMLLMREAVSLGRLFRSWLRARVSGGTAQSIRSRRAELMREGLVETVTYSDGTPVGDTAYGSRFRIYRLTQAGHELARSLF